MHEICPSSFRIYVDADACPVRLETINIASRHQIEVYIVSNGGIRPSTNPFVKTIVVDSGPDEADNWIVQNIQKNDAVITADIPLSARSIEKGAHVISHDGEAINTKNIGNKVAFRNLMSDIRSADPFHQGKGRQFSKSDRNRFVNSLEKIIQTTKKSL
ncbi:MAG: YaiI/YqxD family protein [Paracoccaceae bacterium]|nr:YaiI/YqxD family protein [Paracoccaceae bacterium]